MSGPNSQTCRTRPSTEKIDGTATSTNGTTSRERMAVRTRPIRDSSARNHMPAQKAPRYVQPATGSDVTAAMKTTVPPHLSRASAL